MPTPVHPSEVAPAKSNGRFGLALGGLAVVAGVVVVLYILTPPKPPTPSTAPFRPMAMTPFITPGIDRPAVVSAAEATLPDETPVIGVVAEGKYRAYRIGAFHKINSHVVNDVIGGSPISVTYCDRTQCVRVFTDAPRGAPLKLDLGGYMDKMFLKAGDGFYFQDSGDPISAGNTSRLPYRAHPYETTTWKKWKDAHPTTELYLDPPAVKPIP